MRGRFVAATEASEAALAAAVAAGATSRAAAELAARCSAEVVAQATSRSCGSGVWRNGSENLLLVQILRSPRWFDPLKRAQLAVKVQLKAPCRRALFWDWMWSAWPRKLVKRPVRRQEFSTCSVGLPCSLDVLEVSCAGF